MTVLSERTLGLLIRAAEPDSKSSLATLLMECGLYSYGHADTNKQELLRSRLLGARAAAQDADIEARRGLVEFALHVISNYVFDPLTPPPWFDGLRQSLLADGYELTWDRPAGIRRSYSFGADPVRTTYRLLPTDPSPVPLAPQLTALEAELSSRGFATALNHYRQAVDGLNNGKWESANGDLRSALEELVICLAESYAGYTRLAQANQGSQAIKHLMDKGHLPARDGGTLLSGLWGLSHTNGPHPGQSSPDEARMRMQLVTATARFLLRHFPA